LFSRRVRCARRGQLLFLGSTYEGKGFAASLVAPGLLLAFGEEGPGDDAAFLLPLCHFDGPAVLYAGFFQRAVHRREACRFRYQRREPEALSGNLHALGDHAADEAFLAAMKKHNIQPIDLVCVNLYPFESTIAKPDCSFGTASSTFFRVSASAAGCTSW